jgi:hypothetical protein
MPWHLVLAGCVVIFSLLAVLLNMQSCCSDMKLDNTLFDGQKPPFIKICDFGFARAWQDPALYRMSSRVG